MISAVLIDDMPKAIELLRNDLQERHPEIEIIGIAHSVVEGAKLLRKCSPDILFLDIMLGDGTGFDLLEIVPDLQAKIIFVTASDEYALQAFRFAAIDYLLKPYSPEDLDKAISRARQQMQPLQGQLHILKERMQHPHLPAKRISLHTQEKIEIVEINDIIRCEADGNNTLFHIHPNQRIFVTKTLKQFNTLLGNYNFLRVHQSHLVNVDYIQAYIRTEGGYLKMKNGDDVPVSVRKKPMVIQMMDKL